MDAVSRKHARYLARIGLDPDRLPDRERAALERLQRAHVTSVPFETLAVAGDPVVSIAAERGHVTLRPDAVIRTDGRLRCERSIAEKEWDELLDREFGIELEST